MIDIHTAIRLVAAIIGIHAVYSALELISVRERYGEEGIMNWRATRLQIERIPGFSLVRPFVQRILAVVTIRAITGCVLVASVWFGASMTVIGVLVGVLFVTDVLMVLRHSAGLSGAFQMSLVVTAGLTVAVAAPDGSLLELAGVVFIAVQGLLGYFISGVAKAMGSNWRNGDAVLLVLSTTTWGHPWFYDKARQFPRLSSLTSHAVILFEIAFPIILVLSPSLIATVFGLAIAMHLGISLAMGVNGFVTSFTSTYPAIYYLSGSFPTLI